MPSRIPVPYPSLLRSAAAGESNIGSLRHVQSRRLALGPLDPDVDPGYPVVLAEHVDRGKLMNLLEEYRDAPVRVIEAVAL